VPTQPPSESPEPSESSQPPECSGCSDSSAPEKLPVFVYGTLRPGEPNHARWLRGRTVAEEPARLPGAVLYEGPGYPYAVTVPDGHPHAEVHGDLIHPAAEHYLPLLTALDRLEDYYGPGHPDNDYERAAREVRLPGGADVRAWVYLAAAPVTQRLRTSGTPLPGGDWRGRAAAGADHLAHGHGQV
jgi:gamma-glutamylcyclotransferase (GGCT)/AIG2-like uncharacterized protein YtfP